MLVWRVALLLLLRWGKKGRWLSGRWDMLWLRLGGRHRLWLRSLLDDRAEHGGVNETHEEKSLEDGVRELGGFSEEFGRFGGVAHH